MPIYEYQCKNCGVFEVTQRIVEDPLKECPTCKGTDLHRLISHTSFVLKGSGWYVTDYASKGNAPKTDSPEGSSAEASSTASGDSSSNGSPSNSSASSSSSGDSSSAKPSASSDKSSTAKPAA
jgi:putative FmdB family regulatory protein